MMDKIKAYGWQFVTLALAVGLLVQTQRLADANTKAGDATTTLATERANAERLARQQSEAHRDTERKLREDHDRIDSEAQVALAAAAAGADRARTAGQRLQRELADYITAHRTAALARAAAGECTPDTRAVGVLAELFDRADHRAGELAAIADEARVRGLACESAHDSARTLMEAAAHAQAR